MPQPSPQHRNANLATAAMLMIAAATTLAIVLSVLWLNRFVERNAKLFHAAREPDSRLALVEEMSGAREWMCSHDSVILGSSRLRTVGHLEAAGHRFYSLTANGLRPAEFAAYLDAWVLRCGKEPKVVIVGLDFFGASTLPLVPAAAPDQYIARQRTLMHWLGIFELLSKSRTHDSVDLLIDPDDGVHFAQCLRHMGRRLARGHFTSFVAGEGLAIQGGVCVDRELAGEQAGDAEDDQDDQEGTGDEVEEEAAAASEEAQLADQRRKVPERALAQRCLRDRIVLAEPDRIEVARLPGRFAHEHIYREAYENFEFDPAYPGYLRGLSAAHPKTKFYAVITPTTHVLFGLLRMNGLASQYDRVVLEAATAFGEVWDFGGVTALTSARRNFSDENHLVPMAADLMIATVLFDDLTAEERSLRRGVKKLKDAGAYRRVKAPAREGMDPRRGSVPQGSGGVPMTASPFTRTKRSSAPYELVSARSSANHESTNDCGLRFSAKSGGLTIEIGSTSHATEVDAALPGRGSFALEFRSDGKAVGKVLIRPAVDRRRGVRIEHIEVPSAAQAQGFDQMVLLLRGDKRDRDAYLGHLRLVPEPDPAPPSSAGAPETRQQSEE